MATKRNSEKEEINYEIELIKADIKVIERRKEALEKHLVKFSFTTSSRRGTQYKQRKRSGQLVGSKVVFPSLQSSEINNDLSYSMFSTNKKVSSLMRRNTREQTRGCNGCGCSIF
jgi:hypothetical protein